MISPRNPGHHNQLIPSGSANYKNGRVVDYSPFQRIARFIFLLLIMAGSLSSIGLLYTSTFIGGSEITAISQADHHEYVQPNKVTDTSPESGEKVQSHKVKSIRIPAH